MTLLGRLRSAAPNRSRNCSLRCRLSTCVQVTETQFLRVLAMFSLVPGRADERAALLAYFRGSGAKSHMTDYRAFLQEVAAEGADEAAAGGGH